MRLLLIAVLLLFFSACADKNASPQTVQEMDEFEQEFSISSGSDSDPLEGYNRVMTNFNDATITYVISPVAKGYKKVVPQEARGFIGNFFNNLMFPIRFTNNLLQGKITNAFSESGRFIINTTVGFLGFANVATDIYEIEEHQEDFGQTLGFWGVPSGPHIVLPFFGPSNVRDLSGILVDNFAGTVINPTDYIFVDNYQRIGAKSIEVLNFTPVIADMYNAMAKDAIDLYPLLKNMYEQHRDALIKK
jgi:phospholipid-binding lipoprotein MlaA